MLKVLDGRSLSDKLCYELKDKIKRLERKPYLIVLLVGNNPASVLYTNMKKVKCHKMGCRCEIVNLPESITEEDLIGIVEYYNRKLNVNGVMVQLPLPKHINSRRVLDTIKIEKDVDCLSTASLGKVFVGDEKIVPCTPKGILTLLDHYDIDVEGKDVCVVGASDIVGKPLAVLLSNRRATVTICRSKSDVNKHVMQSDVIISAVGKAGLIKKVPKDSIVIDVGSPKGDVVKGVKCKAFTPVPGGVGPMTIVSLIQNLIILNEGDTFKKSVLKACRGKKTICIFVNKSDEVNTKDIIHSLLNQNKKVVVPVVRGKDLVLSELRTLGELKPSTFGILEPRVVRKVSSDEVEIFFVPGFMFDKKGNRKGRGMGYYDKLLKNIKGREVVGLAYKNQLVEKLKPNKWDVPVNRVILK